MKGEGKMEGKGKSKIHKTAKRRKLTKSKRGIERAREITSKIDQSLSDLLLELRHGKHA